MLAVRAACQRDGHLVMSGAVKVGVEGQPPMLLTWRAYHGIYLPSGPAARFGPLYEKPTFCQVGPNL